MKSGNRDQEGLAAIGADRRGVSGHVDNILARELKRPDALIAPSRGSSSWGTSSAISRNPTLISLRVKVTRSTWRSTRSACPRRR